MKDGDWVRVIVAAGAVSGARSVDVGAGREGAVTSLPPCAGHMERLCEHVAIVRVPGAFGEAWTWCCTVQFESADHVTVKGAQRAPTPSEWRQAVQVGRAHGIRRFRFERYRQGVEEHTWKT